MIPIRIYHEQKNVNSTNIITNVDNITRVKIKMKNIAEQILEIKIPTIWTHEKTEMGKFRGEKRKKIREKKWSKERKYRCAKKYSCS